MIEFYWKLSFLLFHLFIPIVLISSACASNILFFHLGASASHRTAIWPLATRLADVGHNVTYIFPMSKRVGDHPNIEEIEPSKLIPAIDAFAGEIDINIRLNNTIEAWLADVFIKMPAFCEAFYDSPETQEWLARPGLHYDLILMDSGFGQCAYGLVHVFRAKHILFSPTTLAFFWDPFGIVPESASIPEFAFHRKPATMGSSLWSRTLGTISPLFFRAIFLHQMSKFEIVYKEKLGLGDDMPSFVEIEQDTSLVLYNSYFIEDYPTALPPMFVSYSGLSCRKNENRTRKRTLPKNLAAFIEDEQSDGFVYISFGSITDMSTLPENVRNEFFNAFETFPNLKFLWKWGKADVPRNLPKNVYLEKWFPQLDILAHPKIKAFITQAGRSSTQEAICGGTGVPMIAMPIFVDQDLNADRLEHIGAAVILDIASVTTEKLVHALRQLTETDTYKQRLKELNALFRDRPLDPLDNAHFWVEYVLKYNTSLLKPLAMNQTWWQRRLLDVYTFIILSLLTLLGTLILLLVLIFRFVVSPVIYFVINIGRNGRKKGKID